MRNSSKLYTVTAVFLFVISLISSTFAEQELANKLTKARLFEKTRKLQVPFIANNGQTDERVMFYANTFGGTVFVTKDGEIVYSLPKYKEENNEETENNNSIPCLTGRHKQDSKTYESVFTVERDRESERGFQSSFDIIPLNLPFTKGNIGGFKTRSISYKTDMPLQADTQNDKERSHTNDIEKKKTMRVVLNEELVGGKIKEVKVEERAVTKVNYFKGKDPSKWKSNIPTYGVVNLGRIYEGIELRLKAYGNNVEKLFYVKPGTDPGIINIKLSGAKALRVNEEGQLEAETELGNVSFTKPVAYQEINGERIKVAANYSLLNPQATIINRQSPISQLDILDEAQNPQYVYGFNIGDYDRTKELVIDPLLASTYLGGSDNDFGSTLHIDSGGNIYVSGATTLSSDFPTTPGAYDTSYNGSGTDGGDVFISKLDGSLTTLLASTYLGGSDSDFGDIAIDPGGNVYVGGSTWSSDFPTTAGAYDTSYNGGGTTGGDVFISKLDGSLTTLLASTYLGGSNGDGGSSMNIDPSGNVYVDGGTWSSDFPTTAGAYDTSYNGGGTTGGDLFISKLDGSLTTLLASTYFGGSDSDSGGIHHLVPSGNIYVSGITMSSDFPTTIGAYDTSYNGGGIGGGDVFVSKLNGSLTTLLASTYLGGSNDDFGFHINTGGNVFMFGSTLSSDFPTTPGAYDTSYNGGVFSGDSFISKLDGSLTTLLASTYLGGSDDDEGSINHIDLGGNVYVSGSTKSSDFPTSTAAYDTSYNGGGIGGGDVFISKLDGSLATLLASTYLGGSDNDAGSIYHIDSGGNVYVSGGTKSSDFPTTPGAYDTSYNGGGIMGGDVYISKLDGSLTTLIASTYLGGSEADNLFLLITSGENVYVSGATTLSSDFPTTPGAYDTSYNGGGAFGGDVFISMLDSNLSAGSGTSPVPDIKANGSDGPITPTDNLLATVALDSGSLSGDNADWWVAADTPYGWFYLVASTMSWEFAGTSYTDILVTHQGALFNLSTIEVLNIPVAGLLPGTYTLYFAVDMNMNGSLDLDQLYYDSVVVNITP